MLWPMEPQEGKPRGARGRPEPHGRKIRKGTTSCWECKKRKQRCYLTDDQSRVCVSCWRRGKACVTQEFDDPVAGVGDLGATISQSEPSSTSHTLARTVEEESASEHRHGDASTVAPNSGHGEPSLDFFNATLVKVADPYTDFSTALDPSLPTDGSISRVLYNALPTQHDADLIIGAGYTPEFLQLFVLSYDRIFAGDMKSATELSRLPKPTDHPVLLARTLLYLANGIQNLHPSTFDITSVSLGGSLDSAMARYVDLASRMVTSNETMLMSLEGLECLILEAVYHIHAGSFRHAWLVVRRAIGLAQLMGLHLGHTSGFPVLDPQTLSMPMMMWYRIVGQDRYLSLVLGLPPSTMEDYSFVHHPHMPDDCTTGQLERRHYDIMGEMATQSARHSTLVGDDFAQNLARELKTAAEDIPTSWWLVPRSNYSRTNGRMDDARSPEDVGRVTVQINHLNLLAMLHLPSVLVGKGLPSDEDELLVCLSCSRELLSRYIRLRCMRVAPFCCRMVDFGAFTACVAMLSAHISRDPSLSNRLSSLGIHHSGDRALVDETVGLMLEASVLGNGTDVLRKTVEILKCLSAIEEEVVARRRGPANQCTTTRGPEKIVRMKVPFVGDVFISASGVTVRSSTSSSTGNGVSAPEVGPWHSSPDLPFSPSFFLHENDNIQADGGWADMGQLGHPREEALVNSADSTIPCIGAARTTIHRYVG
ncbi:hypothetical protein GGS20DRAFT_23364 [Poronia punctata]|nr:hypothetical protein GGS20DRAFT_23364 [Poronia punctata]